jgi:prevent-host-death family protein
VWQVQEAKQKFSQVLRLAEAEPQWITRQGERVGVLLSADAYETLTGKPTSLADYLINGPTVDGLEIQRDTSPARPVNLD